MALLLPELYEIACRLIHLLRRPDQIHQFEVEVLLFFKVLESSSANDAGTQVQHLLQVRTLEYCIFHIGDQVYSEQPADQQNVCQVE